MAILYTVQKSRLADSDGNYLYYPKVYISGNVNTDTIAKEVADYSSLSEGDVRNVIANFVTVIGTHIRASESVTLDGLGTFKPVLHNKDKGATTVAECSYTQSTLTVSFAPQQDRDSTGNVLSRAMTEDATFTKLTLSSSTTDSDDATDDADSGDSID